MKGNGFPDFKVPVHGNCFFQWMSMYKNGDIINWRIKEKNDNMQNHLQSLGRIGEKKFIYSWKSYDYCQLLSIAVNNGRACTYEIEAAS